MAAPRREGSLSVGGHPRLRDAAWHLYAVAIYVYLYAPLACLVVLSFNDTENITLPWRGFTWRWYGQVLTNRELHRAVWNSATLGVVTVLVAVPCGVLAAYAFRRKFRSRAAVFNMLLLALMAPGIIIGVALAITWQLAGLPPSLFGSTLIGHVTYTIPFVFLIVYPRFHRFDWSLEEAALDLGASRWVMFRTVVMPLVKPGVLAAAIFAFTLSFDEFIRTFFLIGAETTLPIYLWSMMLTNVSPQTNAIAALMVVLSLVLVLLGQRLLRQEHRTD